MKEYRIQAYFKEVYQARTYKGKIFNTLQEAEEKLPEAVKYYSGAQYSGRLEKCVIESRIVYSWKEERKEK